MNVREKDPTTMWLNPQSNIDAVSLRHIYLAKLTLMMCTQELRKAGKQVMNKNSNKPPTLMIVILPENAAELYRAVKQSVLFCIQ